MPGILFDQDRTELSDSAMTTATVIPGTLVRIFNKGVLLTGDSGIGKSDLALALMDRGHTLVADDAVELSVTADRLTGYAPAALHGLLEVRGLGPLRQTRCADQCEIAVVVNLVQPTREQWASWPRLHGKWDAVTLGGICLRRLHLPVASGRPLPLLLEAVARTHDGEMRHG